MLFLAGGANIAGSSPKKDAGLVYRRNSALMGALAQPVARTNIDGQHMMVLPK